MTFCCIKCGAEFPADQSTSTSAICATCEASIASFRRRAEAFVDTYAQRSRKSSPGLNIEMMVALLEHLDGMDGWEAEKLVSRIIGKADTEESEWE